MPRAAAVAHRCAAPASSSGAVPHGPLIAVLRAYLRARPDGLDALGPLRAHLALLLPELGEPAPGGDRATIFEAIRRAFEEMGPAVVVLDDLQWSDEATLALLGALAPALNELPVLVVGAYRSDGLPRDHPLRWLRNELRRGGQLQEVALAPLDLAHTGELLAALLPAAPSPALVRALHDRSQGVPFVVEELARALAVSGRLQPGRRGLELGDDGEVPMPDTVRDAVLMGASPLSEPARAAAEAAAVAGQAFAPELIAGLAPEEGLAELQRHGVLHDVGEGRVGFRHALSWEAFYADVPWLRRRALHRRLAEALEAAGGQSMEIATHWLGARDAARARAWLVRAAQDSLAVYAQRDATAAARHALDLWPGDEEPEARAEVLERYAGCAELAGELPEAVEGVARARHRPQRSRRPARRRRGRSAGSPRPTSSRATARRRSPPGASPSTPSLPPAAPPTPPSSASRWPTTAASAPTTARRSSSRSRPARRPPAAGRDDLRARALGLEGVARAKRGEFEAGLEIVRDGPRARARPRPDRRCRGALPAARARALRLGRLPPRRGGARQRARPLPARRRRRAPRPRA